MLMHAQKQGSYPDFPDFLVKTVLHHSRFYLHRILHRSDSHGMKGSRFAVNMYLQIAKPHPLERVKIIISSTLRNITVAECPAIHSTSDPKVIQMLSERNQHLRPLRKRKRKFQKSRHLIAKVKDKIHAVPCRFLSNLPRKLAGRLAVILQRVCRKNRFSLDSFKQLLIFTERQIGRLHPHRFPLFFGKVQKDPLGEKCSFTVRQQLQLVNRSRI